jgi:ABC-type Mn2+/Zn2+ transport system permease subunit
MSNQVLDFFRENVLFIAVLLVLVGGFIILRTKDTKLASIDEFDALISTGQPVVLEFYSNT